MNRPVCDDNKKELYDEQLQKCVPCHLLSHEAQLKIFRFLQKRDPLLTENRNLCDSIRKQILYLRRVRRSDNNFKRLYENVKAQYLLNEFENTFMHNDDRPEELNKRLTKLERLVNTGAQMLPGSDIQTNLRKDRIVRYINLLPNETVAKILKIYFNNQFREFDVFNRHQNFLSNPLMVYERLNPNNGFLEGPNFQDPAIVEKLLQYSQILADVAADMGMLPEYLNNLSDIYDSNTFNNVLHFDLKNQFLIRAYAETVLPFWLDQYNSMPTSTPLKRARFLHEMCSMYEKENNNRFILPLSSLAYLTNRKDVLHNKLYKGQVCEYLQQIIRKDIMMANLSPYNPFQPREQYDYRWPLIYPHDQEIEDIVDDDRSTVLSEEEWDE